MKSIVVANWKMNPPTMREAKKLFDATRKAGESAKNVTLIVAPPVIFLRDLRARYKGKRIAFAIQSASAEGSGAFTGDISLLQAKDAGAQYVIAGHSEQRAKGESNETAGKVVVAALVSGLTPVLCVGERERSHNGEHFNVVKEQLRAAFSDVEQGRVTKVLVAYEPVWAIGGEKAMSPRDMHEMTIFIRKTIVGMKGEAGMNVKILYGGATIESNALPMLQESGVQGFIVGHVSIDAYRFAALISSLS
ncbi:MAG: triose-phosphate isomerase [Patescibacteria group bacterium]